MSQGDFSAFTVTDSKGKDYTARKIVLATGVRDVLPSTPGLQEGWGKGIFWCGLRAVDKCNEIAVQSVSLQHVAQHVGDVTDHPKGLVPVFVTIAPRTPEDTFAPSHLSTARRPQMARPGQRQRSKTGRNNLPLGTLLSTTAQSLPSSDSRMAVRTCSFQSSTFAVARASPSVVCEPLTNAMRSLYRV
jgi:hypothetical protein